MKRIGVAFGGSHDSIDTYVDGARAAEDAGLEVAWMAEDYFFRDSVTLASAVGQATDSIDLGIFVNPYTRHPAMTAVTAASLDEITGGGLRVAVGAGARRVMDRFVEYDHPLSTAAETVRLVRTALSDEPFEYDGRHFRVEDLAFGACEYLPYAGEYRHPRADVPLYVAGLGPKMLEMAGHLGDGLVTGLSQGPADVARSVDGLRPGLARSGRTPDEFEVVGLVVTSDRITPRARTYAAYQLSFRDPEDLDLSSSQARRARAVAETAAVDGFDEAAALVTDDLVRATMLVGEDDYHRRLDEYVEAGLDVPLLFHLGPDDPETTVAIGADWAGS